jgi:hypothetical protein
MSISWVSGRPTFGSANKSYDLGEDIPFLYDGDGAVIDYTPEQITSFGATQEQYDSALASANRTLSSGSGSSFGGSVIEPAWKDTVRNNVLSTTSTPTATVTPTVYGDKPFVSGKQLTQEQAATTAMPDDWNEQAYLSNKTAQTNSVNYLGRNDWTDSEVLAEMQKYGMNPYEHYQQYGINEGVSYLPTQPVTGMLPQITPSRSGERQIDPTTGTVAGQMAGLLEEDSPYMQRAATAGLQYANDRGLLNTSMGAEASQAAAIDAALPIATSDAAAYNYQSNLNQNLAEDSRQFDANLAESTRQFDSAQAETQRQFDENAAWTKESFGLELGYNYDAMTDNNKEAFVNYLSNARATYDNWVNSVRTSPDLDATAQQALLDTAYESFVSDVELASTLYEVDLDWADKDSGLSVDEINSVGQNLVNQGFTLEDVVRTYKEIGVDKALLQGVYDQALIDSIYGA